MNTFIKLQLTFVLFYGTIFSRDLELKLSLDTTHYLRSQSIWTQVSVCNTSNRIVEVQPLILDESVAGVHFIVKDESGNTLLPTSESIADIFGSEKMKIFSKDSVTNYFDIITWFCNSGIKNPQLFLQTEHFLKEGKYSVRAWTYSGIDTLYSNYVTINIIPPHPKEQIVLQALTYAEYQYKLELAKPEKTSLLLFDEIRQKFPWSKYVSQVYDELIFSTYSTLRNYPRTVDLVLEYAKKYPNKSGTVQKLSSYASFIIEQGRKSELEKLLNKYPNTKIGKYCKRKLSEIK